MVEVVIRELGGADSGHYASTDRGIHEAELEDMLANADLETAAGRAKFENFLSGLLDQLLAGDESVDRFLAHLA